VGVSVEGHHDKLRMGSDLEDVADFTLSDEMGRRVVEGKDPRAVEAGTAAALENRIVALLTSIAKTVITASCCQQSSDSLAMPASNEGQPVFAVSVMTRGS
jgi:hypothetical protein